MKRICAFLILAVVFFSSAVVKAEEVSGEEKEKTFSVSAELGVFSSYINENTGEYANGLMTTAGFSLTHNPSGLYFGALSYISEKGFDEVDVYFGDSFKIKGPMVDLGVVYYNVGHAERYGRRFCWGLCGRQVSRGIWLCAICLSRKDVFHS